MQKIVEFCYNDYSVFKHNILIFLRHEKCSNKSDTKQSRLFIFNKFMKKCSECYEVIPEELLFLVAVLNKGE